MIYLDDVELMKKEENQIKSITTNRSFKTCSILIRFLFLLNIKMFFFYKYQLIKVGFFFAFILKFSTKKKIKMFRTKEKKRKK